jgi:hypothetical protein
MSLSIDEYLAVNGQQCPNCESKDIDEAQPEADGALAWVNARCNSCKAHWIDGYRMSGYYNLTLRFDDARALSLLGGAARLMTTIGAHSFEAALGSVRFSYRGSRKSNTVIVVERPDGGGAYDLEFWKVKRGSASSEVAVCLDIPAEDLQTAFENATGLCLSLGGPPKHV